MQNTRIKNNECTVIVEPTNTAESMIIQDHTSSIAEDVEYTDVYNFSFTNVGMYLRRKKLYWQMKH